MWYFTKDGLIDMFKAMGFKCVHNCHTESTIGREDIESFVFKRT